MGKNIDKNFNLILLSINKLTKKQDNRVTKIVESYMKQNNQALYDTDDVNSILGKFEVNIKNDKVVGNIKTFLDTTYNNEFIDELSFICYVAYSLRCLIIGKKMPIVVEIQIGEYPKFRNSILEYISIEDKTL